MALVTAPQSIQNASIVYAWWGDAAPVDGAVGVGTLAGVAEPTALYFDKAGKKMYIQGGTQAVVAWKIVTSA